MYTFPIHLCEEIMPAPIFYGTIVPLIVYVVVKKTIVEPFLKDKQQKKLEKQRQNNRQRLIEKRKEAEAAIELMRATYSRICGDEENKRGLIIVKALYGKIAQVTDEVTELAGGENIIHECIDVTIPLQCLVKDSKLVLHEQSKVRKIGIFFNIFEKF